MPPLVAGGPDFPIELLEAHAAGKLVIFAGAGISVPAGLPDFKELVERVRDHLGEEFVGEEARLFRRGEYDRVLGLMEGEDRVGPAMRRAVLQELRTEPNSASPVHEALMAIAGAGNQGRVVTTNFDPLFLASGARSIPVAVGPQLPVPREAHWSGLVHLHGLIDEDSDPEGRGLVLTSADFGRAYLLDRWASRFVSELFQNFDVLFVGYGINDPVMRYLLDALAAERTRGGKFREAFAMAGIQGRREQRERRRQEWLSNGIEPIFYDSRWRHRRLVQTVNAWAELARGGLRTKKSWVLNRADHPPSNPQEDDARFVVWALSESSGAVARAFARREPAPDIGWLKIFEESEELPDGRRLLGLPTDDVQLGSGHPRALSNPLADGGWLTGHPARLSKVSHELASWLTRHLDKKALLEWVLRQGGVLHPDFRRQVQVRLGQLAEALLRRLWLRKPRPGAGMPSDIDDLLRQVMGAGTPAGHLARLPLALDLRSLFALDRTWCEAWLLPKFRWQESEESADFWKNYLRHPLVDPDLVAAVKPEFLELFNHLPEVGSSRENAVRLFVFVTVEIPSSFGKEEITAILRGLPEEDLAHAAEALASLLEHSEQPEDLWVETVGPWIEGHWPSGPPARTTRVSRSLAEIALRTDDAFPEAVEALRHRLTPFEDDPTRVDSLLEKLSFAERLPEATLEFLDALVPDELTKSWSWSSLRTSLDQIAEQKPGLRDDDAYRRLDDVVQATGH